MSAGPRVKWAVGVVCLVGAVVVAPIPTNHLIGVILLCAALLLSSRAVETPGGFLFSSFPIPVLVAASVPSVGPWWALAAVVLDTALSLGRSPENRREYFFRCSLGLFGCSATLWGTSSFFAQAEGGPINFQGLSAYLIGAVLFGMTRRDHLPESKVEDSEDRLLRLRSQRALLPLTVGQLFAGFFPFYFAHRYSSKSIC